MEGRRGVQAEVLLSLAVVMVTATALLAAFFFKTHAAQVDRLRGLVGRALIAEVRSPHFALESGAAGTRWWIVSPNQAARPRDAHAGPIDAPSAALALEASRSSEPLLQTGAPWEPIRFASRFGSAGEVAVARLPAAVSSWAVLGLLVTDGAIFLALGASLLRRRVVLPMRRTAHAARALAEGDLRTRLPVEGVGEVAEVAWAFNEMGEALERRTGALEKAVAELRDANQSLRVARDGLDRAERLAAVGRLAAGVAHEVGNPMGAMLAFLDLARRDGSLSDQGLGYLERAAGQGERVRTILRQLLDFSRPPRAQKAPVDLVQLAEQAVGLVHAQRRYAEIDVGVVAEASAVPALADEGVVAQILLNLVLNACDAARGRVELRVRAGPLETRAGEPEGAARERARPEGMECCVADDGPGVPEEDRERVFDPFFTTKPPGEGTGLGLANAQRLAEEMGGRLEVDRDPGLGGAAFVLRLPAAGARAAASGVRRTDA